MREIDMGKYSVEILEGGRSVPLRYVEGDRSLIVWTEVLATAEATLAVNATDVAQWETPHEGEPIIDTERHRIIDNIESALEKAAVRLDIVWSFGDRMPDGTWRWSTEGRAG